MEQLKVRATLMRGGTSRGLFFHEQDLPGPGPERDSLILAAFGSPDPYGKQIDGVGGATSVTSKVVLISPSQEPGCEVNYFFGQVDIRRPLVDWTGTCGNLSAAVGPFAIEEGLVQGTDPVTQVRIWQVNTRKRIIAHVPTVNGLPAVEGDFAIDGVPFPGAQIRLEYLDPGGSCTAGLLPTGRVVDELDIPGLGKIPVTLLDATNPVVFVRAEDVGLKGTELGEEIDTNPEVLRKLELLRSHGAVLMGLASTPEEATQKRPGTPKMVFVSPPTDYQTQKGTWVRGSEINLVGRYMTMGTLHRTYAVSGAVATAAAALVKGSVVNSVARLDSDSPEQEIRIGHPSGLLPAGAHVEERDGQWVAEKGVAYRTARRLFEGYVRVPRSRVRSE